MAALVVGMLGFVVSIIGMECTFIGGKDQSKHKKIFFGGLCHITSGKHLYLSLALCQLASVNLLHFNGR